MTRLSQQLSRQPRYTGSHDCRLVGADASTTILAGLLTMELGVEDVKFRELCMMHATLHEHAYAPFLQPGMVDNTVRHCSSSDLATAAAAASAVYACSVRASVTTAQTADPPLTNLLQPLAG